MRIWTRTLTALAVLYGIWHAARLWWTSDDAYISFRYARQLVRGLGLVYNPGERVEGYSNFLWTLWCALGLWLRAAPEVWANVSGIACYAATLALLGAHTAREASRRRRGAAVIPWAALLGAVHPDWAAFATGGLETAQFTLCAVAAYVALVRAWEAFEAGAGGARWSAAAGVLLALCCLSRPDGVVFAAIGGAWMLIVARRRFGALAAFALPLGLIVGAYAAWKLSYYGDVRPNTYYAKSAARAWWDQGFFYARLYLRRYPPLGPVVGIGLGLFALFVRRFRTPVPGPRSELASEFAPAALATAFGVGFGLYVMWIGGDFMFARFLIPASPFLAILFEEGVAAGTDATAGRRPRVMRAAYFAAGVLGLAAVVWIPSPVSGEWFRHGIVDERAFYLRPERDTTLAAGRDLRTLFDGLPVRVAIVGADAVVAYVADPYVAIEAETGLTDSFIAHQPLGARGRIGHEKQAPYSYLIDTRRVHLIVRDLPAIEDSLRRRGPIVRFRYGAASGFVGAWDAPVMDELRRRGATFKPAAARADNP